MSDRLYFGDIQTGDKFVGDTARVEREQMLTFAAQFDHQPMHLEPEAARQMGFRDIVACGAYIFALTSQSQCAIWKRWHMLPSGLGIKVSFMLPLYADDTLTAHMDIIATRPSSKPTRGWVDTRIDFLNQNGETAVECGGAMLLLCR